MLDNWYETMEMGKLKNETILRDVEAIRRNKRMESESDHHSAITIYVLGGLGKVFSSLGDTLQAHYHFESRDNHDHMKKVS